MQVNRRFTTWTTLLLAGAIAIPGPGGNRPRSKFTHFTGTQTLVAILDIGEWTFTDPTSPDTDIHIRGMIRLTDEDCDDERQTGMSEVVVNANLKSDGSGRLWGTFISTVASGEGGWRGTFVAHARADGSQSLRGVSKGTGNNRGLHSFFTIEYPPVIDPTAPAVGVIDGYIIEKYRRSWRRGR